MKFTFVVFSCKTNLNFFFRLHKDNSLFNQKLYSFIAKQLPIPFQNFAAVCA